MSRVQVPDLAQGDLNPVASPVQRYAQPAKPVQIVGTPTAQQVAQALSQFAPGLVQFAEDNQTNEDTKAIQQAKVDRAKNVMTFAEAQKSGKIRPDQNPWYIKTWKQLDGGAAADQYNRDLLAEAQQGPLANSTDHDESSKLITTFRDGWMKSHGVQGADKDFMTGFATKANGYENNIRTAQTQRVSANIQADFQDKFSQNVAGIFDEAAARGLDSQAQADAINQKADEAIQIAGLKPQEVNAQILLAAATQAKHDLNIKNFDDVLAKVKTGSGYLGNTVNAKKVREQVETEIVNELHQRDMWARSDEAYQREKSTRDAKAAIGTIMEHNLEQGKPTGIQDIKTHLDALRSVDPDGAEQMLKAVMESQQWPDSFETQKVKENLWVDTLSGKDTASEPLVAALHAHDINLKTFNSMMEMRNTIFNQQQARADRDEAQKFKQYTIQPFKDGEASVKFFFSQDITKGINLSLAATQDKAVHQYWQEITDFYQNNPKATLQEINKAVADATKNAVNNFQQEAAAQGGVNSMVNQNAPGVRAGRVAPFPVEPQPAFGNNVELFNNALKEYIANPTNDKNTINVFAKAQGMDAKTFLQQQAGFYKGNAQPKAQPQSAPAPAASTPAPSEPAPMTKKDLYNPPGDHVITEEVIKTIMDANKGRDLKRATIIEALKNSGFHMPEGK